jgi:hypothetical protein
MGGSKYQPRRHTPSMPDIPPGTSYAVSATHASLCCGTYHADIIAIEQDLGQFLLSLGGAVAEYGQPSMPHEKQSPSAVTHYSVTSSSTMSAILSTRDHRGQLSVCKHTDKIIKTEQIAAELFSFRQRVHWRSQCGIFDSPLSPFMMTQIGCPTQRSISSSGSS